MFAELKELATTHIADEPLRRLVLTLLDVTPSRCNVCPPREIAFYPFAGGLLEHTLSVTRSCLHLAERYAAHYAELRPPLNRDLIVAGAILHDIGRVLEFGEAIPWRQSGVHGARSSDRASDPGPRSGARHGPRAR